MLYGNFCIVFETTYVGQTCRHVNTRLTGHLKHDSPVGSTLATALVRQKPLIVKFLTSALTLKMETVKALHIKQRKPILSKAKNTGVVADTQVLACYKSRLARETLLKRWIQKTKNLAIVGKQSLTLSEKNKNLVTYFENRKSNFKNFVLRKWLNSKNSKL